MPNAVSYFHGSRRERLSVLAAHLQNYLVAHASLQVAMRYNHFEDSSRMIASAHVLLARFRKQLCKFRLEPQKVRIARKPLQSPFHIFLNGLNQPFNILRFQNFFA